MNYQLLRYSCLGYLGMNLACAPVSTQVGSNETGTGGTAPGGTGPTGVGGAPDIGGGASVGGTSPVTSVGGSSGAAGSPSPIDAARQMMREKYPDCARYISDANPQVKNGIVQFDCLSATDGPLYYHRLSDGSLISTCGGACMAPREPQATVCGTLCPPPDFGDCVAATGATATVPSCAEVGVCVASRLGVHSSVGTWACQGIDGSSECRGTTYQSFVHDDDQARVQLFFDPTVVGNYSTESFKAALTRYVITLKMPWLDRPVSSTGSTADFTSEISGTTPENLNLTYSDGKLVFDVWSKPIDRPYFWTSGSLDDGCINGDMVGSCVCAYPVQSTLYLHLSLPVQQPQ